MTLWQKIFYPITAPIKFIQNNFKTVLFLTILFMMVDIDKQNLTQPNLQIIKLNGMIMERRKKK